MAEAGVPRPDGPRPERPATEWPGGPERPVRARGVGRDPVALAAWRRVAEQRRRSAGVEDVHDVEDVELEHVEPVDVGVEPGRVDVPGPAPRALDDGPLLRDPGAQAPREPLPSRRAALPTPPGLLPDDGPPAPGRLHEVLLGLAGRIDDDALTVVREMVAAEDDAEAAELLGGCLLADAVGLSADERGVLAPWFATARVDADLLADLPVDPDALRRSGHRFVPTAGAAPAAPLARAAGRLSGVVAVRESWRVTPAGAAPGPVPHRVVLVETADPDDCDHVVHHLAYAARGLGGTSVEVYASGVALPAYHRDALAAARPLTTSDPLPPRGAVEAPRPSDVSRPDLVREDGVSRPDLVPEDGVVREDGETWRTVADAGSARVAPRPAAPERRALPEPPVPAANEPPAAQAPAPQPVEAEAPAPAVGNPESTTSIDDDLSATARRIAALWARPVPEDFSAPLAPESLEQTRLEPQAGPDAGSVPVEEPATAYDDEAGDLADVDDTGGRHGRPQEIDAGTDAFLTGPPPRVNGYHLAEHPVEFQDVDPGEPTPPEGTPVDADDDAQVQRARHSRGRTDEPGPPARFGHDARYGAGPGPAWPGAPVTGDRPGPDTLFTSPVEIGEEPVTLGTNGHRHDAVPVAAPEPERPDEPATGPVSWSAVPPRPVNGTPLADPAPPRPVGDVAPPWATADGGPAWPQEQGGWSPAPAPVPPTYRPEPEPEVTGGWSPDTDDSVAQLSDRERELLARLHEELAQRERAEGTDPFAGPPGRPRSPRPGPPPDRHNGQGPPPGRTNGHGLPGGPDPAS